MTRDIAPLGLASPVRHSPTDTATSAAPPGAGLPTAPVLAARDLHKSFGTTGALRGVDIDLAFGELLAVMGPSGSGKSTLLHCLAGILIPDGGEVRFDGRRVDQLDEADRSTLRRTNFSFLFQFGQLVPELTAVENIALPLLLNGTRRRRALTEARPWLGRLGVDELADRHPADMSGGQAQRVALARALVVRPAVLFADEPTGTLDSLSGEQVMELLSDLARAEGTAVVLVTHDARVAAYADREIVLRDGRVSAGVATLDPASAVETTASELPAGAR
ncbi:MAG: ABC transporter ATP-binding protein [Acidimicrobiales bacterium]